MNKVKKDRSESIAVTDPQSLADNAMLWLSTTLYFETRQLTLAKNGMRKAM
jgi:hypothetical protein